MSASTEASIATLLVGRNVAAGRGDEPAVIDDEGTWTYRELDDAAAANAGALAAAGVSPGDRVAVVLPDGRPWCAAWLGAIRLGAVAVPLEPAGQNLDRTLQALEPALVVAEAESALPDGLLRLTPDEAATGPPADVHPVRPDDPAYMIFSSGSTGWPKGVMHAHGDLATSIDGYAAEILRLGPGDRTYSVAKLFASLGFGNGFFRALGHGACCVLSARRPTVRAVLGVVARAEVTVLTGVPTFWAQLATFLDRHPDAANLSSVRLAVSSGDSLPAAVLERIRELTSLDVVEGFGCSECSNIIFSVRPGERMPGSVGRPVSGVEVRLLDDDERPVGPGTPGRLWVRTASATSGYWRRPDETAELIRGDWLRMGDTMREDDGVYRHLGRSDDLFKVDGLWVSPVEVEAVLHEHPAVSSAAVIALPDDGGLLRVAAFVEPAGDERDEADIRRHVARRIAPYAAPATITWMDELPRGATGKVDRRALRETATTGTG